MIFKKTLNDLAVGIKVQMLQHGSYVTSSQAFSIKALVVPPVIVIFTTNLRDCFRRRHLTSPSIPPTLPIHSSRLSN